MDRGQLKSVVTRVTVNHASTSLTTSWLAVLFCDVWPVPSLLSPLLCIALAAPIILGPGRDSGLLRKLRHRDHHRGQYPANHRLHTFQQILRHRLLLSPPHCLTAQQKRIQFPDSGGSQETVLGLLSSPAPFGTRHNGYAFACGAPQRPCS